MYAAPNSAYALPNQAPYQPLAPPTPFPSTSPPLAPATAPSHPQPCAVAGVKRTSPRNVAAALPSTPSLTHLSGGSNSNSNIHLNRSPLNAAAVSIFAPPPPPVSRLSPPHPQAQLPQPQPPQPQRRSPPYATEGSGGVAAQNRRYSADQHQQFHGPLSTYQDTRLSAASPQRGNHGSNALTTSQTSPPYSYSSAAPAAALGHSGVHQQVSHHHPQQRRSPPYAAATGYPMMESTASAQQQSTTSATPYIANSSSSPARTPSSSNSQLYGQFRTDTTLVSSVNTSSMEPGGVSRSGAGALPSVTAGMTPIMGGTSGAGSMAGGGARIAVPHSPVVAAAPATPLSGEPRPSSHAVGHPPSSMQNSAASASRLAASNTSMSFSSVDDTGNVAHHRHRGSFPAATAAAAPAVAAGGAAGGGSVAAAAMEEEAVLEGHRTGVRLSGSGTGLLHPPRTPVQQQPYRHAGLALPFPPRQSDVMDAVSHSLNTHNDPELEGLPPMHHDDDDDEAEMNELTGPGRSVCMVGPDGASHSTTTMYAKGFLISTAPTAGKDAPVSPVRDMDDDDDEDEAEARAQRRYRRGSGGGGAQANDDARERSISHAGASRGGGGGGANASCGISHRLLTVEEINERRRVASYAASPTASAANSIAVGASAVIHMNDIDSPASQRRGGGQEQQHQQLQHQGGGGSVMRGNNNSSFSGMSASGKPAHRQLTKEEAAQLIAQRQQERAAEEAAKEAAATQQQQQHQRVQPQQQHSRRRSPPQQQQQSPSHAAHSRTSHSMGNAAGGGASQPQQHQQHYTPQHQQQQTSNANNNQSGLAQPSPGDSTKPWLLSGDGSQSGYLSQAPGPASAPPRTLPAAPGIASTTSHSGSAPVQFEWLQGATAGSRGGVAPDGGAGAEAYTASGAGGGAGSYYADAGPAAISDAHPWSGSNPWRDASATSGGGGGGVGLMAGGGIASPNTSSSNAHLHAAMAAFLGGGGGGAAGQSLAGQAFNASVSGPIPGAASSTGFPWLPTASYWSPQDPAASQHHPAAPTPSQQQQQQQEPSQSHELFPLMPTAATTATSASPPLLDGVMSSSNATAAAAAAAAWGSSNPGMMFSNSSVRSGSLTFLPGMLTAALAQGMPQDQLEMRIRQCDVQLERVRQEREQLVQELQRRMYAASQGAGMASIKQEQQPASANPSGPPPRRDAAEWTTSLEPPHTAVIPNTVMNITSSGGLLSPNAMGLGAASGGDVQSPMWQYFSDLVVDGDAMLKGTRRGPGDSRDLPGPCMDPILEVDGEEWAAAGARELGAGAAPTMTSTSGTSAGPRVRSGSNEHVSASTTAAKHAAGAHGGGRTGNWSMGERSTSGSAGRSRRRGDGGGNIGGGGGGNQRGGNTNNSTSRGQRPGQQPLRSTNNSRSGRAPSRDRSYTSRGPGGGNNANQHQHHHGNNNGGAGGGGGAQSSTAPNRCSHDNTPQEQKYLQTDPFSMYMHNKKIATAGGGAPTAAAPKDAAAQ